MYEIQFGPILRQMRKKAGMSQEDIALELHMSISNVSRLETNKYELKAADLIRWANITNSQELLAAMILGVDVGVLQQALEMVTTLMVGWIGGIMWNLQMKKKHSENSIALCTVCIKRLKNLNIKIINIRQFILKTQHDH